MDKSEWLFETKCSNHPGSHCFSLDSIQFYVILGCIAVHFKIRALPHTHNAALITVKADLMCTAKKLQKKIVWMVEETFKTKQHFFKKYLWMELKRKALSFNSNILYAKNKTQD